MKIFKRFFQFIGVILLALVLFFVFLKVNGYVKLKDFYSHAGKEFMIPGLFENFIPQGMEYDDENESFFISGYNSKGDKSPIYLVDKDGNSKKLFLKNSKGEDAEDHCGGVTIYKNYLLVSGGNGASTKEQFIYTFNLKDFYDAKDGDSITSLAESDVYVGTAFVNAVDNILYVGEFNHDDSELYNVVKTTNRSWMPSDCKALMMAYELNDDGTINKSPIKAYAIPDDVQGMLITKDGETVFSTSYGINPSHLPFYKTPSEATSNIELDGVDVPLYYYSDSLLVKNVTLAPMCEAIVYHNDKIYTLNESSSNRYMFGLAFRGSYVYSYKYDEK